MTNEERNTALYQKMFAEQESFRDWLNITTFRMHRPTP